MAIIGKVYKQIEIELADIKVTTFPNYQLVEVVIGKDVSIHFPMALKADINEITLRTGNIIGQTGFFDKPVRCKLSDIEGV
jgi:hypothetical protein